MPSNQGRDKVSKRAALRRDFVWSLLWQLTSDGIPVRSRAVYEAWRGGRIESGIAYADDYIGGPTYFTNALNRLVGDGRATVSRAPGRHPLYVAVEP